MINVRILSYVYFVLLTLETLPANSKNTERLNNMAVVADEVGRLSEENIQLKNRITKLEKLEDRLEEVAKENLILRSEVKGLGEICYRLENSLTKQIVSDIYDKSPQTMTDKTLPKEKTYYTMTGDIGLDHASKENRKGRDMEDLISDHPDLEQHTQNNEENLRNLVDRFRAGRDLENFIPDHQDFKQPTQNKQTNCRHLEKRFREGRNTLDLVPNHPDVERNTQTKKPAGSGTKIYNQYLSGDSGIVQKRLLEGSVQPPSATTKVAFSAFLTPNTALGQHQTVEYDGVLTNIGQGYDPRDGHFTAPVKAIYLFSCTLMNVQGQGLYLEMVKNGVRIAYLFAHHIDYNSASQVVVIALNVGDMVWVRHASTATGNQLHGKGYNTFSGAILFETD